MKKNTSKATQTKLIFNHPPKLSKIGPPCREFRGNPQSLFRPRPPLYFINLSTSSEKSEKKTETRRHNRAEILQVQLVEKKEKKKMVEVTGHVRDPFHPQPNVAIHP